jgi:hypothetical protein
MKLKSIIYAVSFLLAAVVVAYFLTGHDSRKTANKQVEEKIVKPEKHDLTVEQKSPDSAYSPTLSGKRSDNKIKDKDVPTRIDKPEIRIIAYYFHPTARCPTCLNIENFTKEVIQTQFEKEVKEEMISFRALNIEDSVNEHYVNDYSLQYSSLILAKFVNKKQTNWKNLEHVWKFANDKDRFFKYASFEIKGFLREREQ